MKRTAFVLGAVLLSFATVTLARGEQAGKPPPPQEQPGPLGFPGAKHLSEVLMLSGEQTTGVHHIYSEYQKKEHQAQQEAAKEAAKDKNNNGKAPRVDTKSLRDDMANEIKAILTEEQKKKFDEMLADMGKKKKKA